MGNIESEEVAFRCNICGAENLVRKIARHRELSNCVECGSCSRFRGIVKAFIQYVIQSDAQVPLRYHNKNRIIKGIGMSDSDSYAARLTELFDYTNTYYHMTPFLDVTSSDSASQYFNLDFVISSDVLEHVIAPVSTAFANIYAMLKDGGHLILTVPYMTGYETKEHYPELNNFRIVNIDEKYFVINARRDGAVELHQNPVFHGGPGSVLEMRIFGEGDLFAMLKNAGFKNVTELKPDDQEVGYSWDYSFLDQHPSVRADKSFVLVCEK